MNANAELKMLSRFLLISRQVERGTVYLSANDDVTGSLLDSQDGRKFCICSLWLIPMQKEGKRRERL